MVSQLLVAVMDRWPSFSRFGSHKLPRNLAVSIVILRVTYMRPSELLTLKDLVPPLVPLVPFWSVVISSSETGDSTKTGVRDGSVLMDQRLLQWVNQLFSALKARNLEDKICNADYPAAAILFTTATDALGLRGMTMY